MWFGKGQTGPQVVLSSIKRGQATGWLSLLRFKFTINFINGSSCIPYSINFEQTKGHPMAGFVATNHADTWVVVSLFLVNNVAIS
jgi:hypothetical protein